MIKVTVELQSANSASRDKQLGTLRITHIPNEISDILYEVELETEGKIINTCVAHERKNSVWVLIDEILQNLAIDGKLPLTWEDKQ